MFEKKSKKEVRKIILKRLFEGQSLTSARKGVMSEFGLKYFSRKMQESGIFVLEVVDRSKRVVFTEKGRELLKEFNII